jgi:hypothetical protein
MKIADFIEDHPVISLITAAILSPVLLPLMLLSLMGCLVLEFITDVFGG